MKLVSSGFRVTSRFCSLRWRHFGHVGADLLESSLAEKTQNHHFFFSKMAWCFQKKIWKIVEKAFWWSSSDSNRLFRNFGRLVFPKLVKIGAWWALSLKNCWKTLSFRFLILLLKKSPLEGRSYDTQFHFFPSKHQNFEFAEQR